MILVLSFDRYEQGTDGVIDWLVYLKAPFIKMTIADLVDKSSELVVDIKNNTLFFKGVDLLKEVNVVWYRRFEDDLNVKISATTHQPQLNFELKYEALAIFQYIKIALKDKKWIPASSASELGKLETILYANQHNVPVPQTLITTKREEVERFSRKIKSDLIVKPIHHSGYYKEDDYTYAVYTNFIRSTTVTSLPEYFAPTLFQEYIYRNIEIRSFYLDGTFYSSAAVIIGSEHKADIKLHFKTSSINWLPYQLPSHFVKCLQGMMKEMDLTTGSLDIIKADDDNHYLIEINPVGQFSAPGFRCNYYLEKVIAEYLLKNDR